MAANTDTVRKVYDAFGKGDVPTVLGAMDDKVDWQEPASLPYENQVGPQAVAENVFGVVINDLENFTVTPHEIVDGGDIITAIGVYRGKGAKTGVELDADFVHIWRFNDAGKVSGFRTYTDTHLWRQALGVA
ncbi:MAG TPA: nuclear transport factor 2 family protein [Acidimicrobiia bacterium]|nr:nuclear transport factor 2 family protein [Acidimicrobiia bacterium]